MTKIKKISKITILLVTLTFFNITAFADDSCYLGLNQETKSAVPDGDCPSFYNKSIVANAGQGYDNFLDVLNNGQTLPTLGKQVKVPAIPDYKPKDNEINQEFGGSGGNINYQNFNKVPQQPQRQQQEPAVRVIQQPDNNGQDDNKYQYQVNPAANPQPQIPIQYR